MRAFDVACLASNLILTTLEHRWGLPPLSTRDANASDLSNAFKF